MVMGWEGRKRVARGFCRGWLDRENKRTDGAVFEGVFVFGQLLWVITELTSRVWFDIRFLDIRLLTFGLTNANVLKAERLQRYNRTSETTGVGEKMQPK